MFLLNLRIHNKRVAAFKSKTGRVAQPVADAADATGLGFAMCPLTLSYNNYYYYVTLTVKLYGCHLQGTKLCRKLH